MGCGASLSDRYAPEAPEEEPLRRAGGSAPSKAVGQWYFESGPPLSCKWQEYDAGSSAQLNQAWKLGRARILLGAAGGDCYEIDLDLLTQTRMETLTTRRMRFVPPEAWVTRAKAAPAAPSAETGSQVHWTATAPVPEASRSGGAQKLAGEWQWEGPENVWHAFDPEAAAVLVAACALAWQRGCSVDFGGYSYRDLVQDVRAVCSFLLGVLLCSLCARESERAAAAEEAPEIQAKVKLYACLM